MLSGELRDPLDRCCLARVLVAELARCCLKIEARVAKNPEVSCLVNKFLLHLGVCSLLLDHFRQSLDMKLLVVLLVPLVFLE